MSSFIVRGVEIGGVYTKICVPVMPASLNELEEVLCRLDTSVIDILEWRADALKGASHTDYLTGLALIRRTLGDGIAVLFTLRTAQEGGGFLGTADACAAAVAGIAASGAADMIDIELCAGDENVHAVVKAASGAGVRVVASHHNFSGVYPPAEIADICKRMFSLGADIAKVALMPASINECLSLMSTAETVRRKCEDGAIILIGMGRYGLGSRILAQEIGSCITFAYGSSAGVSAPGQISAQEMRQILDIAGRYAQF